MENVKISNKFCSKINSNIKDVMDVKELCKEMKDVLI